METGDDCAILLGFSGIGAASSEECCDLAVESRLDVSPLLTPKDYAAQTVFAPANLLREARRQRGLPDIAVPAVGLLDPDGDIVRYLASSGRGRPHPGWACYHTEMWTVDLDGIEIGVVGMAVGAPFAVLVAEQLKASGAELTLSITSAGQISAVEELPCFVLIEKALRDEGTSLHYQPPARWSHLDATLRVRLAGAFDHLPEPVRSGASWTTDAPYRETSHAIEAAKLDNIACVEMEAAALYAYAAARNQPVVCFAHVTNTMATEGADFEKGADNGAVEALGVARAAAAALRSPHRASG
ncbi:MAG: nucleoside phosphorylase [Actinomycetia bacterium]|nr:nucleoside phosphorylase [Actinomycetes bacterium]